MKIVNLTPHTLVIRRSASNLAEPDPTDLVISSSGSARVGTRSEPLGDIDGVPVVRTTYTAVNGLPEPEEGTVYAVSLLVLQALPARTDLVGPATGPNDGAIRSTDGRIYAVRAWQRM
jgi:hypothetical protein